MEKTYKLSDCENNRNSEWNLQWHSSEHEKHQKLEKSTRHGLERFCSCGLEQRIDCDFRLVRVKTPEPEIKVLNAEGLDGRGSAGGKGWGGGGAGAGSPPHYDGPQWEYKTITTEHSDDKLLCSLGSVGWELVAILTGPATSLLFFKRPKQ